jgi:PTH2 family peptidyl-tRNA hydrolase
MSVKQVIVLRTDLNMRKGKMAAQAAHASLLAFLGKFDIRRTNEMELRLDTIVDDDLHEWIEGDYKKIVVGVGSLDGLLSLREQAVNLGVRHALIQDLGYTEFKEPTYTALAIGPAEEGVVNGITGYLKLL